MLCIIATLPSAPRVNFDHMEALECFADYWHGGDRVSCYTKYRSFSEQREKLVRDLLWECDKYNDNKDDQPAIDSVKIEPDLLRAYVHVHKHVEEYEENAADTEARNELVACFQEHAIQQFPHLDTDTYTGFSWQSTDKANHLAGELFMDMLRNYTDPDDNLTKRPSRRQSNEARASRYPRAAEDLVPTALTRRSTRVTAPRSQQPSGGAASAVSPVSATRHVTRDPEDPGASEKEQPKVFEQEKSVNDKPGNTSYTSRPIPGILTNRPTRFAAGSFQNFPNTTSSTTAGKRRARERDRSRSSDQGSASPRDEPSKTKRSRFRKDDPTSDDKLVSRLPNRSNNTQADELPSEVSVPPSPDRPVPRLPHLKYEGKEHVIEHPTEPGKIFFTYEALTSNTINSERFIQFDEHEAYDPNGQRQLDANGEPLKYTVPDVGLPAVNARKPWAWNASRQEYTQGNQTYKPVVIIRAFEVGTHRYVQRCDIDPSILVKMDINNAKDNHRLAYNRWLSNFRHRQHTINPPTKRDKWLPLERQVIYTWFNSVVRENFDGILALDSRGLVGWAALTSLLNKVRNIAGMKRGNRSQGGVESMWSHVSETRDKLLFQYKQRYEKFRAWRAEGSEEASKPYRDIQQTIKFDPLDDLERYLEIAQADEAGEEDEAEVEEEGVVEEEEEKENAVDEESEADPYDEPSGNDDELSE